MVYPAQKIMAKATIATMIMVMSRLFGIDISFVILLSSMVACWGIEGIWSDVEFEVGAIVVCMPNFGCRRSKRVWMSTSEYI